MLNDEEDLVPSEELPQSQQSDSSNSRNGRDLSTQFNNDRTDEGSSNEGSCYTSLDLPRCDLSGNCKPVSRIPPAYSGPAWLSCFFCCLPLAVLAVINSDKVEKSIRAGELSKAWFYSERTKKLTSLAIIYGVFLVAACIGLYALLSKEATL